MVSYAYKTQHSFTRVFGLMVKVVGTKAVDVGLIPGSSQLRQKRVIGQQIANFAILQIF